MIPSAFVFLPVIPLTTNGKTDTKALPKPSETAAARTAEAPTNAEESMLVDIWKDVLRVENVGLHDNVFEMGAHSLLLVSVHSRLRQSLGKDVPLVKLFQYPSISLLARFLRQEEAGTPASGGAQERGSRQREALARQKMLRRR
ncbi:MAG: hypothetical protein EON58_21835 [Alphaproteobacteria bacterium]|nr:MAG: hypothetical protein EON58_21835 [Alphaproteobacteria bacterium]